MPQPTGSRGFTLMEVIVATVIFSLVLLAVGAVVRTAVRSWRVGHGLSELMQSARISQDVIVRDLHNLIFLNESSYNASFRNQVDRLAQQYAADALAFETSRAGSRRSRRRDRRDDETLRRQTEDLLTLDNISPPLDLSFRSSDGDRVDQLSFARYFQPRFAGDTSSMGIRRVSFEVREGTLYRVEEDAYGFRPGERAAEYYANAPQLAMVVGLFMKESAVESLESYNTLSDANAGLGLGAIPGQFEVEEPLCDGVEVFDMRFGYFKDGEWREAEDWDSGSERYRHPRDVDLEAHIQGDRESLDPIYAAAAQQYRPQPDDLPAYVAIELGLRAPGLGGRIHNFTFFYSIPQSQETDVEEEDEPSYGQTFLEPPGRTRRERESRTSRRRRR